MQKKIISNVFTVLLGIFFSLVLLETGVRFLQLSSGLTYQPDKEIGWTHIPDHNYVKYVEGREIDVHINSKGLRDAEYPYDKPNGVFRILALGDSLTEAVQVRLEDSFTKLIETRLNSHSSQQATGFEVINAGTSGYGTDNELLFLQHEGYRYQPDIVLLGLYIGNDIRNNSHTLETLDTGGSRKPYFEFENGKLAARANPFTGQVSLLSRIKRFLNMHVRSYSFLREMKDNFRHTETLEAAGLPLDFNLFAKNYTDEWTNAMQVTKALLQMLDNETRKFGSRLHIVLIPSQMQVHDHIWNSQKDVYPEMLHSNWDVDKPVRDLADHLSRLGIPYTDLLPGFRRHSDMTGKELYLRSDGHLNEDGHELAAELILQDLEKLNLHRSTAE